MAIRQGPLEMLELKLFGDRFRGRRVLLTGHTGFKGSWLALWLQQLGAQVTGVSLDPPTTPNHWDALALALDDRRLDIRDAAALQQVVDEVRPELVLHLAAQPLVRRSYELPVETWSTNVMGTTHLLEACRRSPGVKAVLVVTTDKCYENREWVWGYRENDTLGGHDPYSASKAATELVVSSYRRAFFSTPQAPLLATARAGNVIGGGDWSADRLIPDLVRSVQAGAALQVRSPRATRPWQHVLESLSGYLQLAARLLDGDRMAAEAWNFGPDPSANRSVSEVLDRLCTLWPAARWAATPSAQVHEATLLCLDSSKARQGLDWQPVWTLEQALAHTADWYRAWLDRGETLTLDQLSAYIDHARAAGCDWARP